MPGLPICICAATAHGVPRSQHVDSACLSLHCTAGSLGLNAPHVRVRYSSPFAGSSGGTRSAGLRIASCAGEKTLSAAPSELRTRGVANEALFCDNLLARANYTDSTPRWRAERSMPTAAKSCWPATYNESVLSDSCGCSLPYGHSISHHVPGCQIRKDWVTGPFDTCKTGILGFRCCIASRNGDRQGSH